MFFLLRLIERAVIYGLASCYGTLALLGNVFVILRHPRTFFLIKKRPVPPPAFSAALKACGGTIHTADKMGLKLSYVSGGDPKKPLMLFVHGFPEFWYSWRYQLEHFSRDYCVVAVDMRGYCQSTRPPRVDDYSLPNLVDDLHFLIRNHLGREKCILVAHDWGGAVSWRFALQYPELIDRLIVLNCPEISVLISNIRASFRQFLKSWYIFFFQLPYLPEWILHKSDLNFFKRAFKGCSKVSPADIECYKYAYAHPDSFRGPLNYYRSITRTMSIFGHNQYPPSSIKTSSGASSRVRALFLWGTGDVALETANAEQTRRLVRDWCDCELKFIVGGNHFLQQDRPDQVNEAMDEFLSRK